jgi:hypothetical protein
MTISAEGLVTGEDIEVQQEGIHKIGSMRHNPALARYKRSCGSAEGLLHTLSG